MKDTIYRTEIVYVNKSEMTDNQTYALCGLYSILGIGAFIFLYKMFKN